MEGIAVYMEGMAAAAQGSPTAFGFAELRGIPSRYGGGMAVI